MLFDSVDEYAGQDVPAPSNGVVRIGVTGALVLTPAAINADPGSALTRLQLVTSIDPKMAVIPIYLINLTLRIVAFMVIERMRKVQLCTHPYIYDPIPSHIFLIPTEEIRAIGDRASPQGIQYAKRMADNPAFYGYLRGRLDEVRLAFGASVV